MKKQIVLGSVAAAGLLLMSFTNPEKKGRIMKNNANTMTYTVTRSNSTIEWKGSKITGSSHTGTIDVKESMLQMNGRELAGGSFTVDMESIRNTDLSGGSAAKLERHLKSEDFFGVERFPEASFLITRVSPGSTENEYMVEGDITIKETTKQIGFPVMISWEEGNPVASASIRINRADFDVRFGSGRFFDNLGNNAIRDEFSLDIQIRPMMSMSQTSRDYAEESAQ
jgi:polyisoprenoid-binding protein YceI